MPRFLRVLSILTATLAMAGLRADSPQPGDLIMSPYAYEIAPGKSVESELGRLYVPENRSNSNGRIISIAFVRLKATTDVPGAPIIYLVGGPGASGIDDGRGSLFNTIAALRGIGDVILVDQRGTGFSSPDITLHKTLGVDIGESIGSEHAISGLIDTFRAAANQLQEQNVDLTAYNTNENADDIDDLRKALGASTVRIWAHSYGTHLALALIRRHPESIERVILGGTNGPDQRWRLPADLDGLLARMDLLVRSDPRWRDRIPNLPKLVSDVLAGLEAQPAVVPVNLGNARNVTVVLGKQDVQVLTALQMGDVDFVSAIPALYYGMSRGDFSQPTLIAFALKNSEIGTAMRYSMHCASGVSAERLELIQNQKSSSVFGDQINFPFSDTRICAAWGVNDLGPEFRAPVTSDIPTLFISATLDGRTSIEDAQQIRAGFPNSSSVILDGSSHSRMFSSSPGLTALIVDFLSGTSIVDQTITVPFSFK